MRMLKMCKSVNVDLLRRMEDKEVFQATGNTTMLTTKGWMKLRKLASTRMKAWKMNEMTAHFGPTEGHER